MSRDEEVVLVELSEDSTEYMTVVQNIDMTLRNKRDMVEKVQNPYLWGSIVLRKEYINNLGFGIVSDEKLFHATVKRMFIQLFRIISTPEGPNTRDMDMV